MGTAAWSVYDEGYCGPTVVGFAGGGRDAAQEATAQPLGPSEIAPPTCAGRRVRLLRRAEDYRRSFLLVGGPVGLALTGAASYAHNQSKKAEAQRAASRSGTRWAAPIGDDEPAAAITLNGQLESLSRGGRPAHPYDRQRWHSRRPFAAVEHAGAATRICIRARAHARSPPVDGRPPGVPMPEGLLDRARAQDSCKPWRPIHQPTGRCRRAASRRGAAC